MNLVTRQNFVDVINGNNYQVGVEIGVRQGWFSKYILDYSNIKKWYAIDPWHKAITEGSSLNDKCIAYMNLNQYTRCAIIEKESIQAAKLFKDSSVDFVYADGCHLYHCVVEDICYWWPKIKTGGILAGHDYNILTWPGVVAAVKEFAEVNHLQVFTTGVGPSKYGNEGDGGQPSWYLKKP